MSEWLSIEDHPLPDDGEWVWGYRPHGSITDAFPIIYAVDDDIVCPNEPRDGKSLPITHWMSIPSLPEVAK